MALVLQMVVLDQQVAVEVVLVETALQVKLAVQAVLDLWVALLAVLVQMEMPQVVEVLTQAVQAMVALQV